MNTKIVSLLTAFGLCINAAFAGNSARVGFASDYFYRGDQKSQESIQSSITLNQSLGTLNGSIHVCSNQALDTGNDSYHMGAGASTSVIEGLLSAYVGINHFEDVPGDSVVEAEVRASFDVFCSPSITVFRNLDESLYTYELGISQVLETKFVDLSTSASYGNTETSSSNDSEYYVLGVSAAKDLSESASLGGSVQYVDSDSTDDEFVFGVGLTFNF